MANNNFVASIPKLVERENYADQEFAVERSSIRNLKV